MNNLILYFILFSAAFIIYAVYLIFHGSKQELHHEQLSPAVSGPQFIKIGAVPPEEPWTPKSIIKEFNLTKQNIKDLGQENIRPNKKEGLKSYFGYLGEVWRLTLSEKEIITFALLQIASIAIGYYIWVQMLGWIPPEVWKSVEHSEHASWPDLILLLWSFVCVGIAAFPLSIFSACIGAVYFLRRQGYPSTIAACLKIVLSRAWALWIFQWMDSWITVNQILERLPKKRHNRPLAQKALSEALYFAWKLATIGILPALVTGRGLVESCRDSIAVVKSKFLDAAKLRIGYSLLCWIVGVSAYIGTIFFFIFGHFIPRGAPIYGFVYVFYFWAGIPLLVAVAIIQLFLRPAYIVGSCELYSRYLIEQKQSIMLPHPPSKSVSAFVFCAALCLMVSIVFIYRSPLGITAALSVPYPVEYSKFESSYLAAKRFHLKGNYSEAMKKYSDSLKYAEDNEEYAMAHYGMGYIYMLKNQFGKALEEYDKAMKLDGSMFDAYQNRAVTFRLMGRFQDSVDACYEVLRLFPNSGKTYFSLGYTYELMNRNEDAIMAHIQGTRLNWDPCRKSLPRCFSRLNNKELTAKLLEELAKVDNSLAQNIRQGLQ